MNKLCKVCGLEVTYPDIVKEFDKVTERESVYHLDCYYEPSILSDDNLEM